MIDRYEHNKLIGKIFGTLKVVAVGTTNELYKKTMVVHCTVHQDIEPYENRLNL